MYHRRTLLLLVLTLSTTACSGDTSVFDLEVGDCFNDQTDLALGVEVEIASVETVDCSEPHDNEIFYEYSMTETVFPGNDSVFDAAIDSCIDQFNAFVGIDYLDSDLGVFPITPTFLSWDNGDRDVYCALFAMDLSKLTGSLRGSQR